MTYINQVAAQLGLTARQVQAVASRGQVLYFDLYLARLVQPHLNKAIEI